MNFKKISNKVNHPLVDNISSIWAIVIFIIVSLSVIPNIPQRTHELASYLYSNSCSECGLGHLSNLLITTPIYFFISHFFYSLKSYYITQILFLFISLISIVYTFTSISNKKNKSLFFKLSIVFSLLILFINLYGYPLNNIPAVLGLGYDSFSYNFSVRSIVSIGFLLSCLFFIQRKFKLSGFFILISMIAHPTYGVVIFLSFIGVLFFNFFFSKDNDRSINKVIPFLLVGLIFVFLKLFQLNSLLYEFNSVPVTSKEYIKSMYMDEANDFSAIFKIISHKKLLLINILFCFIPIFISIYFNKLIKERKKIKILSIIIITLFIIFFSSLLIEIIFYYFQGLTYIIEKIINTQLGIKALKYSGIPAVLIWVILLKNLIEFISKKHHHLKKNLIKRLNTFSLLIILFFSIVFFLKIDMTFINKNIILLSNKSKSYKDMGRISYYEDLLSAGYNPNKVNKIFIEHCGCENIYTKVDNDIIERSKKIMFKNEVLNYVNNLKLNNTFYESYNSRKKLIKEIKDRIPKYSKIITPPYFYCFRELLHNYDIYFQEHDDGNFMLGSKIIYEKFKPRMNNLFFSYIDIPSSESGLNSYVMRKNWLNLNKEDFKKLNLII